MTRCRIWGTIELHRERPDFESALSVVKNGSKHSMLFYKIHFQFGLSGLNFRASYWRHILLTVQRNPRSDTLSYPAYSEPFAALSQLF